MPNATLSDRSSRIFWFMQKKYSDNFMLCATHCYSMGMPRLCDFQCSSVELPKMWSRGPPATYTNIRQAKPVWVRDRLVKSFRCFLLSILFGSSSTTILLNLVYTCNYHSWYNLKISNSIKILKVVCCISAEYFLFFTLFKETLEGG